MERQIVIYKKRFDRALKHIKAILTQERQRLPYHEWLNLVYTVKEMILTTPQDFFCFELPSQPVVRTAIEKVFDGFLEDQRIRAIQSGVKIPSHL